MGYRFISFASMLLVFSDVQNVFCYSIPTSHRNESTGKSTEFHLNLVEMVSEVNVEWVNKTTMTVIWPNRTSSSMLLIRTGQCQFEGIFDLETYPSAAIVGCIYSEETILNIGTEHGVLELVLLKNGTTLKQGHLNGRPGHTNDHHLRNKRGNFWFLRG